MADSGPPGQGRPGPPSRHRDAPRRYGVPRPRPWLFARGAGPGVSHDQHGPQSRRSPIVPLCGCLGRRLPLSGRRGTVFPGAPAEVSDVQPPGGARADPPAAVQPVAPQQAAALPVAGMRGLREARAQRRATRHAAHGTQDAPVCMPADRRVDETASAPAGAGGLPTAACSATRPLQ